MLVSLLMLLLLLCSVFSPSFAILNFACTLLHSRTQLLEELQQFYATHCKSMLVTTCLGTATFILRPSVIMAMIFFALVVVIIHRYLSGTYARKDAFLWLVSTLTFHYLVVLYIIFCLVLVTHCKHPVINASKIVDNVKSFPYSFTHY